MENTITITTRHLEIRQRKEIVIVEPDDAFADFLTEVLRQETPYSIFRVASGERAIQVVPQLKPDLLILNLQPDSHSDTDRPTMSGFEVFEHLHAIDELSALPTLLFNTNTSQTQGKRCNALAIDTLFDVDYLLQTIDDLLA